MARSPAEILSEAHTIALVGASPKPHRPSHGVMRYLLDVGYDVIPVRPGVREILGRPCVASLREIERPVDVVDVFRRSEFCGDIARETAEIGAGALWLQLGVVSAEARAIAEAAEIDYVEDECTAIVHRHVPSRMAPPEETRRAASGRPPSHRGARIRTGDLADPNGARYQAAPHPERE